jgi:hypothetical protein
LRDAVLQHRLLAAAPNSPPLSYSSLNR